MDLVQSVLRTITRYKLITPGETVVVGVSGGPDSLCLLHVLREVAPALRLSLHVAHVNHGLRGAESDSDATFVAETAAGWSLPCTVERADVAALAAQPGVSTEEAARTARYAFLARLAGALDVHTVAVGHNADDQAETVLMHWLRGSGLAGLRGMTASSPIPPQLAIVDCQLPIDEVQLTRPLLFIPRSDILHYCQQHGLSPRFDRSNEDVTFFRNRLRHELLPLLEGYNPQIRRILRSSAAVIADDYELLRGHLLNTWPQVVVQEADEQLVFDLAAWRGLPTSLQRATLREAISRLRRGLRNVNFVHVENALWALREGEAGTRITLTAGLEIVLGYSQFALGDEGLELPLGAAPQLAVDGLALAAPGLTALPGSAWQVESSWLAPAELPAGWQANADPWQAWLDGDALGPAPALRVRREGDRFQPLGLGGKRKLLGEFFTNVKAPLAARGRWPLLVNTAGDIAWVCGLRLDERARVTPASARVLYVRMSRQVDW